MDNAAAEQLETLPTAATFDPLEAWPCAQEDQHFTSGVNHPGEVRGLAGTSRWIGITVSEIRTGLVDALVEHCSGPLPIAPRIFVDSGAFGEVRFSAAGREVVKPITDAEWVRRLGIYRELCTRLRPAQLYLVAPDAVGEQAETLRRLEQYAPQVRELRELGANLIVVLQRGELGPVDFLRKVVGILGFGGFVIGIPSKKAATTVDGVDQLCRELWHAGAESPRFHLLGMGPASPRYADTLDAIFGWFGEASITSDAVEIKRKVGRTNGRGGGPRALTAAQDRARASGLTDSAAVKATALIEIGELENREQLQRARRAGWFDPELESAPGVPLEEGCIEYGPGGPFGDVTPAPVRPTPEKKISPPY